MPSSRQSRNRCRFSLNGNLRPASTLAFAALWVVTCLSGNCLLAQSQLVGRRHHSIDSSSDGSLAVPLWLHLRRQAFQFERPIPANTNVYRNVRYARRDGVAAHLLSVDIYSPTNAARCPVMIYVHGGRWSFGDKYAMGNKVPFFSERGWVLVSINYRLLPEADPLVQVQDVADAIAWTHNRIARFGGNPDELFLMGHSAGAHLVALAATDSRRLEQAGKDLSIVRGVIELDTAALDVVRLMKDSGDFYGRFFGDNPAHWKAVSPRRFVASGKAIPPFLLAVAADNDGKSQQAKSFAETLHRAGIRAEVLQAPDKTHASLNRDLGRDDDAATAAVMEFVTSIRNRTQ